MANPKGIPEDGNLNRLEAEALVDDSLARFKLDFEPDLRQFLVELAQMPKIELQMVHAMMKQAVETAEPPVEPTESAGAPEAKPRTSLAALARKRPPGPGNRR